MAHSIRHCVLMQCTDNYVVEEDFVVVKYSTALQGYRLKFDGWIFIEN